MPAGRHKTGRRGRWSQTAPERRLARACDYRGPPLRRRQPSPAGKEDYTRGARNVAPRPIVDDDGWSLALLMLRLLLLLLVDRLIHLVVFIVGAGLVAQQNENRHWDRGGKRCIEPRWV